MMDQAIEELAKIIFHIQKNAKITRKENNNFRDRENSTDSQYNSGCGPCEIERGIK